MPRSRRLLVAALTWTLCASGLALAWPATTPAVAASPSSARATTGTELRVGSYNIGGVQTDKSARGDHKPWRQRRDLVAAAIASRDLDVVGVQEANPSSVHQAKLVSGTTQYADLLAALAARGRHYAVTTPQAYNCARATSGTRCTHTDHGSALSNRILYDPATLAVVSKGSTKYAAQTAGRYDRYLEWAVFRVLATGRTFLFTNTHLDPYSPANREAQWKQWLARTAQLRGSMPVISVGDYNTTKFSTWAKRTLPLTRRHGLSDVLEQRFQKNPGRPRAERVLNGWLNSFNGYRRDVRTWSYFKDKRKQGNVIDWIFTSQQLRVPEYEVVASVDKRRLRARGTFASDHHLVRATVVLP